ncbi:hypothetical protein GCM10010211_23450 [Streptomyces albospinus]|uniref:Radical SAM core domain-containing protein n=1 Tax=Streptomyces albospinus TaxID=285515 RepID=A0ABQ2V121_9ACTN|nr:radical SAM protein [Streptomyces albospinus]GGU57881.1 hypothetical protein GCM10010211_23450 [Streptomyces albospinus]
MTDSDANHLPVTVVPDRTLRVKIIDACGLACTFCHNEGTPVTTDNLGREAGQFTGTPGRSGRVSIYLSTNSASFLPERIKADSDFASALAAVRGSLPTTEVHFTGGEPTLHPELPALVRIARRLGLTVGLTSNGENGAAVLPECAAAGLDRINLSVFGTTPEELAAVQAPRLASPKLAARKPDALAATTEGYYGVRMYRAQNGPFMVGVCIQRMDLCLTLGEFVMSQRCAEVRDFREEEAARLTALHRSAAVPH